MCFEDAVSDPTHHIQTYETGPTKKLCINLCHTYVYYHVHTVARGNLDLHSRTKNGFVCNCVGLLQAGISGISGGFEGLVLDGHPSTKCDNRH